MLTGGGGHKDVTSLLFKRRRKNKKNKQIKTHYTSTHILAQDTFSSFLPIFLLCHRPLFQLILLLHPTTLFHGQHARHAHISSTNSSTCRNLPSCLLQHFWCHHHEHHPHQQPLPLRLRLRPHHCACQEICNSLFPTVANRLHSEVVVSSMMDRQSISDGGGRRSAVVVAVGLVVGVVAVVGP